MEKNEDKNYPEIDLEKIYKKNPNKFVISIAAAKRAKQLKEGIKPLVEVDSTRPYSFILIALKEILEEKIEITIEDSEENSEDKIDQMDRYLQEELNKEK